MIRFLLPLVFLLSIPDAEAHNREVAVKNKPDSVRVVPDIQSEPLPHYERIEEVHKPNLGLLIRQGRYRLAWA